MKTKSELRKYAKNERCKLPMEQISCSIVEKFKESSLYENANNIFSFYSFGTEVNTHSLFLDSSKNWFVPKVYSDKMCACKYCVETKTNKYGIEEPFQDLICDINNIDLIILPALMVDSKGYRLGYGKGFYDKFLAAYIERPKCVVFIPDELTVSNLPRDKFDIPAKYIFTQTRFIQL